MWTEYGNLHPLFDVLKEIEIPRSTACDKLDVKCVDRMALFVKLAAETGVQLYMNDLLLH